MPQTDTKRFPLTEAYDFAQSHGFAQDSLQIREMPPVPSKSDYITSIVRRGYIIELFEQNGLLDQFIKDCWLRGTRKDGAAEISRCLKVKSVVEKEMGRPLLSFSSPKPSAYCSPVPPAQVEEVSAPIVGIELPLAENSLAESTVGDDLDEIAHRNIDATSKSTLVNARVGQGQFRTDVLKLWGNRCAVTGSTTRDAIRASHILPWRDSSDAQRLDPNNGLPLIASLDALFDTGLISFNSSGSLLVSSKLTESERKIFGLDTQALLKKPSEKTATYLAGHRQKHGFGE